MRAFQQHVKPAALSGYLRNILRLERALDLPLREQERYYVVPGTAYGKPLYDHVYNCMVEIARLQPATIGNLRST
jgi:hypothetical protein